jgi:hypothetical protein
MGLVSDGALSVIRHFKELGFSDTALRLVYEIEASGNSYGRPAHTEGKSFPCRFAPKPSPDALPGADVQMTDATLHFGLDTVLLPDDRVRITHIHGDKVTAADYRIVAGPVRESIGQQATLLLVKE